MSHSTSCESHGGHHLFVQYPIDTARHMAKIEYEPWKKTTQWQSICGKLAAHGAHAGMIPNVSTVSDHCDVWAGLTRPHGYNDILCHLHKTTARSYYCQFYCTKCKTATEQFYPFVSATENFEVSIREFDRKIGLIFGKWFPPANQLQIQPLALAPLPDPQPPRAPYRCTFNDWREQGWFARQRSERLEGLVDRIMDVGYNGGLNDQNTRVEIMNLLTPFIDTEITESWAAWGWQPAD